MSKKIKIIVSFTMLTLLTASFSKKNDWILITNQDNVSFYYNVKSSRVSDIVTTTIKIINENAFGVKVTYQPKINCPGKESQALEKEMFSLDANGAFVLHTFNSCSDKAVNPSVEDIAIEKI